MLAVKQPLLWRCTIITHCVVQDCDTYKQIISFDKTIVQKNKLKYKNGRMSMVNHFLFVQWCYLFFCVCHGLYILVYAF